MGSKEYRNHKHTHFGKAGLVWKVIPIISYQSSPDKYDPSHDEAYQKGGDVLVVPGGRVASAMGKIRKWKSVHTGRGSSVIAVPQLRTSWEKRLEQRADREATLAAQREVDEQIRAQKRAEREEREVREKRKEDNKQRGLQYQVITNTAKIKKMSKKQLRLIKKADTSGVAPKIYSKKDAKK